MSKEATGSAGASRIEVTAELDRRAAEALALEIRHLAKRHGIEVVSCQVLPVTDAAETAGEGCSAEPGQGGADATTSG